jgi:hypothetical protein
MRWFRKLASFFEFPPLELSPEREKELIEKIAQEVSRRGMEIPALIAGWGVLPTSPIYGNLFLTPLAPFLEGLGIDGYKIDEIAAFVRKRENVSALINRIEQLKEAKEGRST